MLKGYRRLRDGVNPELEMGAYLTEVAQYPNCAPLAGVLEYLANDGKVRLLAMLQGYVANQGDGWTLLARVSAASPGTISNDARRRSGARQRSRGVSCR